MNKAEADALLDVYLAKSPNVRKAAQAVMEADTAKRTERKEAEKRAAEAEFVFRQAAGLPPPDPPKLAFEPIVAYSAAELRTKDVKAVPVIVDGILPAGLSLLAGAPKRGKSWLVLALAIAVATGGLFLGRRVMQGIALYLDLESGQSRAKNRLAKLGGWPDTLHIAHRADLLGDNGKLLLQIADWLDKHPDTRLIIIDTVGRVKGGGRRGENAYETDTRIFGSLQSLAMERSVAIVGVHHYKKGVDDGDDWFEKISGSMGLTGVCDTVLALTGKRDEQECVLKSSSRDFEGIGDMELRFDEGVWFVDGTDPNVNAAEKAYRESGIVRGILALMDTQSEWQGEPTRLVEAIMAVYHGTLETYATNKLTERLEKFRNELYERDNVSFQRDHKGGRRIILLRKATGGGDFLL